MKRVFLFGLLLCACLMISATDLTEIVWATPEWPGLTSSDGKALFNEIITQAFAESKIKVKIEIVPWARSEAMLQSGEADLIGGLDPTTKYPQAKYPMTIISEAVCYKLDKQPKWNGFAWLSNKKGVWIRGYTNEIDSDLKTKLQGDESNSRSQALQMMLADRVDFYFDNISQMNVELKLANPKIDLENPVINGVKIHIEKIFSIKLYMTFSNTERGKYFKEKYNQGLDILIKNGKLKEIYKKWNELYPID